MHDTNKKELGRYYTPPLICDALCRIAIKKPGSTVLEPSFGGCAFLESIKKRLIKLGVDNPYKQMYGCDIDEQAFEHLTYWGVNGTMQNFLKNDFLKLKANDFGIDYFDVIIGNPPFVSIHNMTVSQKEVVKSFWRNNDLPFEGRASLWAYFVIHSCHFLKVGGNLCFILPQIAQQTFYGQKCLDYINKMFESVHWYSIQNSLFEHENINEKVGILFAKNFQSHSTDQTKQINVFSIGIENLDKIDDIDKHHNDYTDIRINKPDLRGLFPDEDLIELGKLIEVKIGAVTGDNNFFVIDDKTRTKLKLNKKFFIPIVRRFEHCGLLNFTIDDWKRLVDNNERVYLFYPPEDAIIDVQLTTYLESYSEENRIKNRTFAKRELWWKVNIGPIPDAFFPYMNQTGPKITLNSAKAQCTNNIHKIFFKNHINDRQKKIICLMLNTTISKLSGELEGRVYSSGVLKFEPSSVKKILIPNIFNIKDIFESNINNNYSFDQTFLSTNTLKSDNYTTAKNLFTNLRSQRL